jgi:CRISPR-associated protein Cmr4
MTDFRVGYLYSLAPIHCGGEGDLGNILEIAREVHTNFPYVPGSSLRGSLRDEVLQYAGEEAANRLFGKELNGAGQMGVHQVWFGDARLLWMPMRTMAIQGSGRNVFTWVSCHSLIQDHALISRKPFVTFPDHPVGTNAKDEAYLVSDAEITVRPMSDPQKTATLLSGNWANSLSGVQSDWAKNHIVLPDDDFQVLMEHSLWTQVRNKIQENENGKTQAGAAEIFWTDVCIPRDTILYFPWGYNLLKDRPGVTNNTRVTADDHNRLIEILQGLLQVGGQANVGRGWVQSWVTNSQSPVESSDTAPHQDAVSTNQAPVAVGV